MYLNNVYAIFVVKTINATILHSLVHTYECSVLLWHVITRHSNVFILTVYHIVVGPLNPAGQGPSILVGWMAQW